MVHRQFQIPQQTFEFEGTEEELITLEEFLELMSHADDLFNWEEGDVALDEESDQYIVHIDAPGHFQSDELTEEEYNAITGAQGTTDFTDEIMAKVGQILEPCQVDEDCEAYPFSVCGILYPNICGHKKVMPLQPLEYVGLLTFGFVMALCTVAGIGGGGIAISLIIAFFKFTTKPAVAISSFTILVCTTMRFIYNFRSRNPEKPGMILLDYSLASVMMPTTLAGSQFGSFFFIIFPSLYIQILLTLLLGALAW